MAGFQASIFEKAAYKLHLGFLSDRLRERRIYRLIDTLSGGFTPDYYSHRPDTSVVEEKVFVFWAQGEENMPPVVGACIKSIRRVCGEQRVVSLNLGNLKEWVTLPSFLFKMLKDGSMTLTHFSDILRFCLLEQHGGWWLDATIFISHSLPPVSGLFTVKSNPTKDYVSEGLWSGFIWHMPKKYPLAVYMKNLLLDWWSRPDSFLPDYFFLDYCIRWFYLHNNLFRSHIDALPVSNPDMYFFQSSLCDSPYNVDEWERVSARTTFFKTTYKNTIHSIAGSYFVTLLTHHD